MIKETKFEKLQREERDREEEIKMFERIYKNGAGCFGVSRRSPEIKKELDRLRRQKP